MQISQAEQYYFKKAEGFGECIYQELEVKNWAPWLRFTASQFSEQAKVFPDGQFLLVDLQDRPVAYLSTNRIQWNGDSKTLQTWDKLCGPDKTYKQTYVSDGNTLVCMSISIHANSKGNGIARLLMNKAKETAVKLSVDFVIGDYRPASYGSYKKSILGKKTRFLSFLEYCKHQTPDGRPYDAWLRSLSFLQMRPLVVDNRAMVVCAGIDEFEYYRRTYNPSACVWL